MGLHVRSQQTPGVWGEVTVGLHLGLALKRSLTGYGFLFWSWRSYSIRHRQFGAGEKPSEPCDSTPLECAWNNNGDLKGFYGRGSWWRRQDSCACSWRMAEGGSIAFCSAAAPANKTKIVRASGLNQPKSISISLTHHPTELTERDKPNIFPVLF